MMLRTTTILGSETDVRDLQYAVDERAAEILEMQSTVLRYETRLSDYAAEMEKLDQAVCGHCGGRDLLIDRIQWMLEEIKRLGGYCWSYAEEIRKLRADLGLEAI